MSTQSKFRGVLRPTLLVMLAFVLFASACSSDDDDDGDADDDSDQDEQTDQDQSGSTATGQRRVTGPISVSLSQGEGLAAVAAEVATVEGTPLDAQLIAEVVDRLPAWMQADDDQVDFNRPPETILPPRTGDTIDVTFPVGTDDPPPVVDSGPLEILRIQPDGDVGIAPFLSITFNQPMVPLTTVEQLDEQAIPATLTPALPGRWQWIGTRTLRFEHDPEIFDRFPMATSYVVEIPAGTTSEAGGVLAETVRVEFETPPPSVLWLTPESQSLDLEPVFFALFDQRIDTDAVIETVSITADSENAPVRLATSAEIEADENIRTQVERAADGQWIAFRAAASFQPDQSIRITIGPDVPSAEGPNTSDRVSTFSAHTYSPLKIEGHSCTRQDPCQPDRGMSAWFNNTLDPESLDAADVVIEPALVGRVAISVRWSNIEIAGSPVGDTTYEVTFPASLKDEFGQSLGEETTVEFVIDNADPRIDQLDRILVTLDPLDEGQTLPVTVRNHDQLRVRIFDVSPFDWEDYRVYYQDLNFYDATPRLPNWPELYDRVVDTDAVSDVLTEARIDLEPALSGDPGHVVVIIEAVGALANLTPEDNLWWRNRPVVAWVQATSIGVGIVSDHRDAVVWTTDLRTGDPLPGVEIELVGRGGRTTTGSDGLARIDIEGSDFEPVVARLGDDVALLQASGRPWTTEDETLWYVVDDRNLYRPGETIEVKGWVRNLDLSDGADIEFVGSDETVTWRIFDGFGNELETGSLSPDDLGGFDFSAELPLGANLGRGWIAFSLLGVASAQHQHSFRIEEFRRPEFEVTARPETEGPYFVDEPATVAVDATYFSGGPLPDAEVNWTVRTQSTQYSPPSWGEFTFGVWTPWWIFNDFYYGGDDSFYDDYGPSYYPGLEQVIEQFTGTTDRGGTHYLRMDFEGDGDGLPTTVTAESTVFDVNRQAWSSSVDLLVHPADLYAGLRSTRTFVRAGDPLEIEAIVTDVDGAAVPGRSFMITADLLGNEYDDGEWTEVVIDSESCELASSDEAVSCTFAVAEGGRYRIGTEVIDDSGRTSRSELTRWVTGGDAVPNRRLTLESATLVPDKEIYESGDLAEILVESPFESGQGLLTVSRGDIVTVEPFAIVDYAAVLEIPIRDALVPGLLVQVELVGVTLRTADDGTSLPDVPKRPAYASGAIELRVPPIGRTLTVAAEPADATVEPGVDTSVDVEVTDASGNAVDGAGLLVVVVDEAVLALSGYDLLDPVDIFYRSIRSNVSTWRGHDTILLADPAELQELIESQVVTQSAELLYADVADEESADDSLAGANSVGRAFSASPAAFAENKGGGAAGPIEVRQDFGALAVFAPDVRTDSAGKATVDFTLPDNLTRYRVMVVAVDGVDRFGSAESNLTARLPLQVRPSAPRFLNFGDEFELPIVVQNLTDAAMEVDVIVETSNLEIIGAAGRRVSVPANDRIEVRFPARTDSPGTARFRAAAVSADHADAAAVSLPVYTPATSEAFATYGVIDSGSIIQPILAPENVFPQFGGLEINTSSTALQALTDAVLYLSDYEYQSADAYASRILAISALRDVLEAFEAEGLPSASALDQRVRDDITALSALQNFDGGFGSWRRDQRSSPFRSIQAMHALVVAKSNGYSVSPNVIEMGRFYLQEIERHIPSDWSQSTKDLLSAYALHVRWLDGNRDSTKALALYNRADDGLGLDALAWIWPVVDNRPAEAAILRTFNNRVTETAGAATFTTSYGDEGYLILHSERRTDGIILDGLITMAPDSDLIPKVVAGLLGNQIRGRWNNVQENSFILLALNHYFNTFESVDPDFVARVWLGDLYAAEHEFSGRSTDRAETLVPMAELLSRGSEDLVLAKDGAGRMYYRLGLRYAPDDLDLDPLDRGFVVQRTYEAIDHPDDVWLDDDGVWHVKAGAEVRVRVTMVNDSRRTNMALIDSLPAGLETLNPALAVTAQIAPEEAALTWWNWTWYEHQNLRDDRAEAFTSYLWAGTHEYSYLARATTPGTFVVPPARAEEIYAPEVFGRSGSDVVVVEG